MMTLPPRLLFVTESFAVGGAENHLLDLLPALKRKGFDVAVFCFTEKTHRAELLEKVGIPVYVAPGFGVKRKLSFTMPLRIVGGAVKLYNLIRRFRPSVVHFFLPGPYLAGAPVALAAGVPIKLMSRRSLADYQRKWPGANKLERALHKHMDCIVGNSQAVVNELITEEDVPADKVRLIYNGVRMLNSGHTREHAREDLGYDDSYFIATTVANLFPYKGHKNLVRALATIADKLPQPWVLLCAGRDGGSAGDINKLSHELGIASQVRVLGERSDVPKLLSASDIFVLAPTRNESFSNAVLEAMAAGAPVIATAIGGNAEAIVDNWNGLVVRPNNVDELGAAILKLARDSNLRNELAAHARERVAKEFPLDASIDKYIQLYEELLRSNHPVAG
jgi:glycosyltransferase involved in cell wall biosynthesis